MRSLDSLVFMDLFFGVRLRTFGGIARKQDFPIAVLDRPVLVGEALAGHAIEQRCRLEWCDQQEVLITLEVGDGEHD